MTIQKESIIRAVQKKYGSLADQYLNPDLGNVETQDCCTQKGNNCGTNAREFDLEQNPGLAESLYRSEELTALPDSVTDISLGCGNPHAIAGLQPGETVLDLGSGGGIDCFIAARSVGPTGYVIGVDMTDSMLELANKNKTALGLQNVLFRKGRIDNLPVESDSVDIVISNCVINLVPDKAAVFQEAFRVLKPGGRFAVSDIVTEGNIPPALRNNINTWVGCITGAIDQAAYLAKLRQAGFVDVAVTSRASYGIEAIENLSQTDQETLNHNVDWTHLPDDARIFSAQIVARKPGNSVQRASAQAIQLPD